MITLIFDGEIIDWNKERSNFTFEASEVPDFSSEDKFVLRNPVNGNEIVFKKVGTDKDGSGEDTYGWRYEAIQGNNKPCTLLAIND